MRGRIVFFFAAALLGSCQLHAQTPTLSASPIQLRRSGEFEVPLDPRAMERTINSVGKQIDAKRAVDAVRSPLWDLAVWGFLPKDPAGTLNSRVASDDDPFFTPEYLKVSARQLDDQLKRSEKASRELFR